MRPVLLVAATVALSLSAACAPTWKQTPHDRLFQREVPLRLHQSPDGRTRSDWWDRALHGGIRPLARTISPARYAAALVGGRDAVDVNAFGQVPDSGWFENRIGKRDYTAAEITRGSGNGRGPADGPLRVIGGKIEGASAGFVVRDKDEMVWYVKLDPPAEPELATSAEVVAARLLWLAGYHVPHALPVDVATDRFALDPKARTRDDYNRRVPMRREDLDGLLRVLNSDAQGRVRALFSRKVLGQLLGPLAFRGRRDDDPNDRIPHEHRRSLRGLWLFFGWLNNTDARAANTVDAFMPVTRDGRGFIRHYLLDFGNSLGSGGVREKSAGEGHQYVVDWTEIGKNWISLGLRYPSWRLQRRSPFRSVGIFNAAYNGGDWRPEYPNPAFETRTRADIFWAASILARIQPEHVRAAVEAGRYSEPGAADYVVDTLLRRRHAAIRYGLRGYAGYDRPRTRGKILELDDLRALGGLPARGDLVWSARWNRTGRGDRALALGTSNRALIDLTRAVSAAVEHGDAFRRDPFISVTIGRGRHGPKLEVHLRVTRRGEPIPVALDR